MTRMARGHICRTGLSIWRTPEACQEIRRGLSERQRAQPPVIRSKKRRTPAGCEESLHPYRVRLSLDSLARWYALKNARVPPANFRARLRRGAKSINLRPGFFSAEEIGPPIFPFDSGLRRKPSASRATHDFRG